VRSSHRCSDLPPDNFPASGPTVAKPSSDHIPLRRLCFEQTADNPGRTSARIAPRQPIGSGIAPSRRIKLNERVSLRRIFNFYRLRKRGDLACIPFVGQQFRGAGLSSLSDGPAQEYRKGGASGKHRKRSVHHPYPRNPVSLVCRPQNSGTRRRPSAKWG
jgi:hypothetical protein